MLIISKLLTILFVTLSLFQNITKGFDWPSVVLSMLSTRLWTKKFLKLDNRVETAASWPRHFSQITLSNCSKRNTTLTFSDLYRNNFAIVVNLNPIENKTGSSPLKKQTKTGFFEKRNCRQNFILKVMTKALHSFTREKWLKNSIQCTVEGCNYSPGKNSLDKWMKIFRT